MRFPPPALLLAGLLLAISGGEAAWAAKKVKAPARARVPAAASARAGLRGAQPVTSLTPTLGPAPPSMSWPPPSALRRLGQGDGTLASAGLVGLRAHTDSAPLCRTACAQVRYQCQSGENGDSCDGNWGRCVLACREPLRP